MSMIISTDFIFTNLTGECQKFLRILESEKKSNSANFRTNLVEFRVKRSFSVCNTLLHLGILRLNVKILSYS